MKSGKLFVILVISALLVVGLSHMILVKRQALEVKSFAGEMDRFRAFNLEEKAISETKEKAGDKWISELTLNYLYQGMELKEAGNIDRYSMFGRLLQKGIAEEYEKYFRIILSDAVCFPVPKDCTGAVKISYDNSWLGVRSYGGSRSHEGCDIMPSKNEVDYFPVQSISEGTVEKIGWLELGGYRIGIRSPAGAYYYYAHLSSYAYGLKAGDKVSAGQTIGKMGNTGYGPEGTSGKFAAHLHFGIYFNRKGEEISVNPYHVLKYIEKNRKTFTPNEE